MYSKIIKCNFCDYQFKVFSQTEKHYDEYDLVDQICYYPLPEENAHPFHGYVCDNCYYHIGDIIRNLLIESGKEYISKLQERKDEIYQKYLKEIDRLNEENNSIQVIYNKILSLKSILDFDKEIIDAINYHQYPYTVNATYYLNSAIKEEKITKLNMKYIKNWEEEYNVNIKQLPSGYESWSLIDKDTFKNILLDSELENMTIKQVLELVNKI